MPDLAGFPTHPDRPRVAPIAFRVEMMPGMTEGKVAVLAGAGGWLYQSGSTDAELIDQKGGTAESCPESVAARGSALTIVQTIFEHDHAERPAFRWREPTRRNTDWTCADGCAIW
jgi:hypothetical protein